MWIEFADSGVYYTHESESAGCNKVRRSRHISISEDKVNNGGGGGGGGGSLASSCGSSSHQESVSLASYGTGTDSLVTLSNGELKVPELSFATKFSHSSIVGCSLQSTES